MTFLVSIDNLLKDEQGSYNSCSSIKPCWRLLTKRSKDRRGREGVERKGSGRGHWRDRT